MYMPESGRTAAVELGRFSRVIRVQVLVGVQRPGSVGSNVTLEIPKSSGPGPGEGSPGSRSGGAEESRWESVGQAGPCTTL
jgi:hypothetical protein